MEHRRVCFRMLSLLPLVQISKLSQANSLLFGKVCCRTPRGVRGLKLNNRYRLEVLTWSHPSRGAWIEIIKSPWTSVVTLSRTPRGVRGLKYLKSVTGKNLISRTPRGVRGLKCHTAVNSKRINVSHPSRGAWIEIPN